MENGARNALKGIVNSIKPDAVNTEVVLQVAAEIELTAIRVKSSSDRLGLSVGKIAYTVIKSSDVIVAID